MTTSFPRIALYLFGVAVGALIAGLIPMYHEREFSRIASVSGLVSIVVWEYELWGNICGILITIVLRYVYGTSNALRFGLTYAATFATIIFARAPSVHSLVLSIAGAWLGMFAALFAVTAMTFVLRASPLNTRRWSSWNLPTRISIALTLIGFPIALLAWFGIQPHDIFTFPDPPKPAVLKFIRDGRVFEFHGTDGTTLDRPIYITAAPTNDDAKQTDYIAGEYYWIHTYYPRYRPVAHGLFPLPRKGFAGETIIQYSDGKKKTIPPLDKPTAYTFIDVITTINWMGRQEDFYFDASYFAPERTMTIDSLSSRPFFFTRCTLRPGVTEDIAKRMRQMCPYKEDTP